MSLPVDIGNQVDRLFPLFETNSFVKKQLSLLWETPLNVGPDQLARSILVVSGNNLDIFMGIFASGFRSDPRDIIMQAESMSNTPGNFGLNQFIL